MPLRCQVHPLCTATRSAQGRLPEHQLPETDPPLIPRGGRKAFPRGGLEGVGIPRRPRLPYGSRLLAQRDYHLPPSPRLRLSLDGRPLPERRTRSRGYRQLGTRPRLCRHHPHHLRRHRLRLLRHDVRIVVVPPRSSSRPVPVKRGVLISVDSLPYLQDSSLVTPLTPSLIISNSARSLPAPVVAPVPTPMVAPMPTPGVIIDVTPTPPPMFHAKVEIFAASQKIFTASQKNLTASRKCFTVCHCQQVSPLVRLQVRLSFMEQPLIFK